MFFWMCSLPPLVFSKWSFPEKKMGDWGNTILKTTTGIFRFSILSLEIKKKNFTREIPQNCVTSLGTFTT